MIVPQQYITYFDIIKMPFFEKVNQLDKEYLGFEPDFLRPVPTALLMKPEDEV